MEDYSNAFIISRTVASGGIYRWPYTVNPFTGCVGDSRAYTWQEIHEEKIPSLYGVLQKYRVNGEGKV